MLTIFTGQSVIGKLVLHLVTSLADKKLSLATDEKKRACRSFVELYQYIDRLEELTIQLTEQLKSGVEKGFIEPLFLEMTQRAIKNASNRFIESQAEVHHTISIIDPALAESLSQLYDAKYSFLLSISYGIADLEPATRESIPYLDPDDRIVKIDMSKYADWHTQRSALSFQSATAIEWPQSLLWHGDYEAAFTPSRLILSDFKQANALAERIEMHSKSLADARELLRKFIADNFSVDEILYVSRNLERETW